MRKLALLAVCVGALLVAPGIAAADRRKPLTGSPLSAALHSRSPLLRQHGGTSYVGTENDLSGSCAGDSGQVTVGGIGPFNVVCAHYVASSGCCDAGSHKMRFAFQQAVFYEVVRITDNPGSVDTFARGITTSLADAQAWVNKGERGCHCGVTWTYVSVNGDFTVAP